MDLFVTVIVIFLLIIIFGVIIYITIDNMEYRHGVGDTIKSTTNYVNDIDDLMDILSSNMKIVTSNINMIDDNQMNNKNKINIMTSNMMKHDDGIETNMNMIDKMSSNIETNKKEFGKVSTKINHLDNNLQRYFEFLENNEALNNNKLFEHRISGIQPELNLISQVTATGGMTVKTSDNNLHDNNMKICNEQNNCVQLNVNSNGFNITPDNLNKLTINAKDNQPMALFNMQDKSIYLGGVDNNSPLFIQNGELYANKLNIKENGIWSEFSTPRLASKAGTTDATGAAAGEADEAGKTDVVPPLKPKDIIASYTFVSAVKNIDKGASYIDGDAEFMQLFIIDIQSKHALKEGDSLMMLISTDKLGNFNGMLGQNSIDGIYGTELFDIIEPNEYYIQQMVSKRRENFSEELTLKSTGMDQYLQLFIKIIKDIDAGTPLSIECVGINFISRIATSNLEIIDGIPVTVDYKST